MTNFFVKVTSIFYSKKEESKHILFNRKQPLKLINFNGYKPILILFLVFGLGFSTINQIKAQNIDADALAAGAGIGTSTVTYTGSDGNVLALVRLDGQGITSEATLGAGLGRQGTDWQVGDTESYLLTFQNVVSSTDVTIGFFNNNIDGEEELYDIIARDASNNVIPLTYTNLLGGMFVGSNQGNTNSLATTSPHAIGDTEVATISVSATAIKSLEFTRQTYRLGQFASGAFGLILQNIDYMAVPLPDADNDGVFDSADLDNDNDGILDADECPSSFSSGSLLFTGAYTLSVDGSFDTDNITINKPVGATVAAVYALSAGHLGINTASDLTINGIAVTLDKSESSSSGVNGITTNRWGDVTASIGAMLNALPVGASSITMSEVTPANSEGSALFVVWNDPNKGNDNFISIKFSAIRTSDGSTVSIPVASLDTASPNFKLTAGIAISYNSAVNFENGDISINGNVLGSAIVFGYDDGANVPGKYWTIGDDADPFSLTSEKYDISNLVSTGETSVDFVFTSAHPFDFLGVTYLIGSGITSLICDTDGDGTPDHLDTDSDGDGCPDALEAAGAFTAGNIDGNGRLTGGVDPVTGIPNVAGAGQATTADVTTVGPDADSDGIADACDPIFNDNDNDGIADADDLDDDNDGILDSNECLVPNLFWSTPPTISGNTATGTINGINYTYTSDVPVISSPNIFNHATFPASFNVPNQNPTIRNDQASQNTITFDSPVSNPVLVFSSIGTNGGGGISVPIIFSNPVEVLFSQNVTVDSPTQITGTEGFLIVRMNGIFTNIGFNYTATEVYSNFVFGTDDFSFCDTDNDTIPDYLDTDSDNDGCPDAIEAAGVFTIADLDVNERLTGGVDANGVPNVAGTTGQATTNDVTFTGPDLDGDGIADACDTEDNRPDFDNDGIPDVVDLDDDNDGILDAIECNSTTSTLNMTGDITDTDTGGYPLTVTGNGLTGGPANGLEVLTDVNISTILGADEIYESCDFTIVSTSFDDGFQAFVNGAQVLYFDESNWNPDFGASTTEFKAGGIFDLDGDGTWEPWANEGEPQLILKSNGEVHLYVNTTLGTRVDALPYMDANSDGANGTWVLDTSFTFDCLAGVDIRTGNANDNGLGEVQGLTITANVYVCKDTDGNGVGDSHQTDADADGCADTLEAGHTDPDDDGILGNSPVTVDANGQVTGQGGYTGTNAAVTDDTVKTACNADPVAVDDVNTTPENVTLTVNVAEGLLDNDSDPENDPLTVQDFTIAGIPGTQTVGVAVNIPGVGDITINADGSYNFDPATDYVGVVPTITYTISDGNGGTATADLDIEVLLDTDGDGDPNVTDPDDDDDGNPDGTDPNPFVPTAVDDDFTAPFGGPTTFNILTNDDFLPGADTSISQTGGTAGGTVSFDPINGTMTYTPTAAEAVAGGTVTVEYTVCNTAVNPDVCDTAIVTITITDLIDNDGDGVPNGQETLDTTDPNDTCSYNVISQNIANVTATWNTADCDGDGVTNGVEITDSTDPKDPCSLIVANQDTAPNPAWNAADCDGDGNPNNTDSNPLVPTAEDDTFPATFGSTTTFNILTNDDFLPGANTSITQTGGTASGTISFDATTGEITYTPTAAEATAGVPVTVVYQVCNTAPDPDVCDTATITINITDQDSDGDGVPDGQEATDGTDPNDGCSYDVANQVIANVTSEWNALDCDGDGVINGTEITDSTDPQDPCDLVIANQTATPDATWNAADCDGDGNPNNTDPNPLTPVAENDTFPATFGSATTFNILTNDDFLPGANTNITQTGGTASGTISFDATTGEITYTPTAAEATAGVPVTVIYQVCNTVPDPDVCDTATITINITDQDSDGDGVPDGQEATDGTDPNDGCSYDVANQVIANVTSEWNALDCDGDGVINGTEITDSTDPQDPCDLVIANQTATPDATWNAADCDGDGNPNNTDPNPLVPTAEDDTFPATFGSATTFNILANDDFLLGANTSVTQTGGTASGTISFDATTGEITYTPTAAEATAGVPVTVIYQVCNTAPDPDVCDTATITINITDQDSDGDGVPDGQEATDGTDSNDGCSYDVSNQVIANVTAGWNALDCDGDGVINGTEITDSTDPKDPCDLVIANQTATPDAAWNALDCDNDGNPNGDDPNPMTPTAVDDTFTAPIGEPTTLNILTNDDFLSGVDVSITQTGGTAGGTVSFDPLTGEVTYTPLDAELDTEVTIEYQVCNTAVDPTVCDTAIITITVNNPDSDGDGVLDEQEVIDGTDPNDPCSYTTTSQVIADVSNVWNDLDCDGDGVINGTEIIDGTDPQDMCDFVPANRTLPPSDAWNSGDCDEDTVSNEDEWNPSGGGNGPDDTDGDGTFDYLDIDDDNDGVNTIDEDADNNNDPMTDDCDNDNLADYLDPDPCEVEIPTLFTPDGDGINDVFEIPGLASMFPNFKMKIYNRWGNIVFDYNNNGRSQPLWWDGFSDGRMTINNSKKVPTGTYFYVIEFNEDNRKPASGWIYLNR